MNTSLRLLVSVILFSYLGQAYSQITLSQSDLPGIGDVQITVNVDSLQASSLSPGLSGDNILWNFGDLLPCCGIPDSQDTITWLDSHNVDVNNNFPGAELATDRHCYTYHSHITHQDEKACHHNFFFKDNQGLKLYGTDYPVNAIARQYQLVQPLLSYSEAVVVFSRMVYALSADSLRTVAVIDSIFADGWGSLVTPVNTYNALRIRTVETSFDTLFISSSPVSVVISQGQSWKWFTNGIRSPLLQIGEGSLSDRTGSRSAGYLLKSYNSVEINETEPDNEGIRVFPNPFSQTTMFHFGKPGVVEKLTLIIFDLTGKQLIRIDHIHVTDLEFSRGNMPSGSYFYRVIKENGQLFSGKIIIL